MLVPIPRWSANPRFLALRVTAAPMPRFKARNCEACGGLLSMHPQTLKECWAELDAFYNRPRPLVVVSGEDDEWRRFYGPVFSHTREEADRWDW